MLKATISEAELARAIPYKRFDNQLSIQFDQDASNRLGKEYWRVKDTFKFYYGNEENPYWVIVPAGFLTDGASVPRILWWLLPPWSAYSQAAAVHDYLLEYATSYHHGRQVNVTRGQADRVFRDAMRVAGIGTWPRQVMYVGVRLWGKIASKRKSKNAALKRDMETHWEFASASVH